MKIKGIMIEETDQVVTVTGAVSAGDTVVFRKGKELCEIRPLGPVPVYHKIACENIGKGDLVHKYGQPIGTATQDIQAGEWVHTHNLCSTSLVGHS